jgi:hypothetical protein
MAMFEEHQLSHIIQRNRGGCNGESSEVFFKACDHITQPTREGPLFRPRN